MTSNVHEINDQLTKQFDSDGEETEKKKQAIKEREGKKEYLKYVKVPQDKKAKIGESVTYKAIIIGKPSLSVQWRFNGEYIKDDSGNFVISSKGNHYKMTVKEMTTNTVGDVDIIARNRVGVAVFKSKLELLNDGDDSGGDAATL